MDKGGTFKDEKKKKVTNSYLEVCIYVWKYSSRYSGIRFNVL